MATLSLRGRLGGSTCRNLCTSILGFNRQRCWLGGGCCIGVSQSFAGLALLLEHAAGATRAESAGEDEAL